MPDFWHLRINVILKSENCPSLSVPVLVLINPLAVDACYNMPLSCPVPLFIAFVTLCYIVHHSFMPVFMFTVDPFFWVQWTNPSLSLNVRYSFLYVFYLMLSQNCGYYFVSCHLFICEFSYFTSEVLEVWFLFFLLRVHFHRVDVCLLCSVSGALCYLGEVWGKILSLVLSEDRNGVNSRFKSWCYLAAVHEFIVETSFLLSRAKPESFLASYLSDLDFYYFL